MKAALAIGLFAFFARDAGLRDQTAALTEEITTRGHAYADLTELTNIGPRMMATPNAERAIAWAKAKMEAYGFENVRLQPMRGPLWRRGETQRATLVDAKGSQGLHILALGGSVGTPAGGLDAEVVEVKSLAEVEQLGEAVKGKIVFYNRPMDPTLPDTFQAYGGAVDQRASGPSVAGRHGAVGVIVRSVTTLTDDVHPHTGMLYYSVSDPRVPAVAVSTRDANELSRRLDADPALRVRLELSCGPAGEADSFNVLGEITGSEHPEEIVVVGGHLDSWDVGPGAHDDGAGVVHTLEAVRAMHALGVRPKRTIRAVLFMAEESGGWGGEAYAAAAKTSGEKHVAAIESDRGGFAPTGFTTSAGADAARKLQAFAPLLAPLGADTIGEGGSGTDVEPLRAVGAVPIGFIPVSTHYFDYHHAEHDVLANVVPKELSDGAAAIATLAWSIAENGL